MKKGIVLTLCVLLVLSMVGMAFAGDNEGKSPLSLVAVTSTSGNELVELTDIITMEFSNNVVNMSVQENNMKCFSVRDSSDTLVEVEIFMGDDQVDRDIKRLVEIRPKDQWQEGETYTILVSGELSGKNEMLLQEDTSYEFKTVGSKEESSSMTPLIIIVVVAAFIGGAFIAKR